MKRCIVNISVGGYYPKLGDRLERTLRAVGDTVDVVRWTDHLPEGTPQCILPFRAYCAKPLAIREAANAGYDSILWLDSAYYALRCSGPLFAFIESNGYYTQDNIFKAGEWCSDAALETLQITRPQSMIIPEISTSALGLNMTKPECVDFLNRWCELAMDGITFMAAHANSYALEIVKSRGFPWRTIGPVSRDTRVMGHRHDQTAASVLAWRFGWRSVARPTFCDYWKQDQEPSDKTIFLNNGDPK